MDQANHAAQETSVEPNVVHIDPVAVLQELAVDRDFSIERRKFLANQVLALQRQVAERDRIIVSRDERICALEAAINAARVEPGKVAENG